jgi:hypothetical protein
MGFAHSARAQGTFPDALAQRLLGGKVSPKFLRVIFPVGKKFVSEYLFT